MEQSMVSFKFECVDLDVQNQTEHYGRFVFNSLDVGTGQTIGTLLRRVLLTNLPGLRIVAVKIPGVTR
jgi:DNA-directed RNA polymerase subunit alpha